ncbi:MAG TPA: penicillin acylase family protein [Blastocatellia bacterium]|nr:penicillin acylase family protein [Blastocatellia bacterium]HMZ20044.1 penicillin acylase family protein [Blastocatellia bacterium]
MNRNKFLPALLSALLLSSLNCSRVASQAKNDLAAKAQSVLSQTSGTLKFAGLQKAVRVLRDEWGIAHIYAETQDDLFFAQGFVAAQDRLWQMDLWRRQGEGKLAEILGPSAVERDKFARLVRYRGDMKAEYESYAPDAKQIIEAFVRGVNAQIALVKASGKLPIEFQLAGYEPEPWTPEVCLTRMAGYVMTRNASTEVQRAQLAREFGKEFVDEWVETDPKRKLELPEGLDLAGIDSKILAGATAAGAAVNFAPNPNSSDGSNNWVIDGTMSATGKPLLANDPHRQIALPSLRYMVHLNAPGWNVIGAGEPSLPGVAAGHNERVGFGFTIVGIDQQDLYVEEVNPANPNEYRRQGKWQTMRVERERFKVKGEAVPRDIELKFTEHGPVIYEDKERHRAYALKWVGSEPGTAGYLASLSLNRAQNWPEFLKALERWKVPSENLVYADVDGNIGWVAAGMTPVRKGWSGLMPVPGNGQYEWQGFLPLKDLPQSYNPAKHFIATANHNILPPGYDKELGYEWANPTRFLRIAQVLGTAKDKLTVADFERLQHDEVSLNARALTATLAEAKNAPADLQPFVELLTKWNWQLNKDSAAAALYEIWLPKLAPAVFKPHVPEKAWASVSRGIQPGKTIAALRTASPQWFGKDAVANRDALLWKTLAEAVAEAKKLLGEDSAKWRWGKLHVAPFVHPLSTNAERKSFFDLPAAERGGDANTVFATGGGTGFRQSHGASFREILDVADWDRSVGTNVPGQSAQPGSKHYGDLLPLWAEGKYFPLLYSRTKVEAAAKDRLMLEPK